MASNLNQLHFVLIPLMSPGHLIPMVDFSKLLAKHGVVVSIVTTPGNTVRFKPTIDRAAESGLMIRILQLRFPAVETGLPEGCENIDQLPSRSMMKNYFNAVSMLQEPFEQLFDKLQPRPSCIITGKNQPWTVKTALKFKIPRIFFDGMGCFAFSCTYNLEVSKVHETVSSKFEPFLVPGLPHRIELTRAQLPENLNPGAPDLTSVRDNIRAAERESDGIIVNTFEELETGYIKEYKRVKGGNIWCIGPVSGCNELNSDKAERGQKTSIDESRCLKWLDSKEPASVVYACLGSICGLTTNQLVELGLGMEASSYPFIWVIREGNKNSDGLEKWISEEGFEQRIEDRGLIIRGWAPQVLILSHPAVGAFLTHCGWNSTVEGLCAGVPIIACPLFAEQFYNEKLVVEVLGIGASVGVEAAVTWGLEEKAGLVMKREQVKRAVEEVMGRDKEAEERRRRVREWGEMAKRAIEEGGSSYKNMEMMIKYVLQKSSELH
ncbi:hypothetical protein SLE2022_101200 [Rubroshorea leprosula]